MTQEVQPLTWSKRTNIEEHQQFFSKINEIIGNLAPTVDEAEQAIAQATAAITSATDAVATANAASAAASAAASQAQTAASTVAGYDGRLTAAEGDIDALQGRMGTAEGKNSQQDTAIAALQTADTNNVKITGTHAIGDYAVLLTGNQGPIAGVKTFANNIKQKNPSWEETPRIYQFANIDSLTIPDAYLSLGGGIEIRDMNEKIMWSIKCYRDTGGRDVLSFEGKASDGTTTGYFHLELAPNGYRKITTNFEKPSTW